MAATPTAAGPAQIPRYVRTDAAAVRVRRAAPRGTNSNPQPAAAVTLEVGSVHGGRCPLPLVAAVAVTLPVRSGCLLGAGARARPAAASVMMLALRLSSIAFTYISYCGKFMVTIICVIIWYDHG